ncbi:MAG: YlbF family regulator [Bacillota bacterium]
MSIIEKAHELGDAIASSEELLALRQAEADVASNDRASGILQEYRTVGQEIEGFRKAGKEPSPQLTERFTDVQGQMETNPVIKAQKEAQLRFNNLVEGINFILNRATGQEEKDCRPRCGGGCCKGNKS